MIELSGDIWDYDVIVVPTNGVVRANGSLVMGAGVAKDAVLKFPGIDKEWGALVEYHGNNCYMSQDRRLISFPTKHHWMDKSDPILIERSAFQLVGIADRQNIKKLAMPRIGCGLGGLKWETVRTLLTKILDDRFVVLNLKGHQ
jgi:hypothetical protein